MCRTILFLFLSGLLGLCLGQGAGGGGGAGAGGGGQDAIVIFESPIYTCPDELSMSATNASGLEVINYNDTTSMVAGPMVFLKALPPDQFRIVAIAEKEVSGKLEVVFTKEICDLCQELHEESDYWKYIKLFGLPPECPFPPGQYMVAGFKPHPDDLPVYSGNPARYIVKIHLYYNKDGDCDNHDNEIYMGCLLLVLVIE